MHIYIYIYIYQCVYMNIYPYTCSCILEICSAHLRHFVDAFQQVDRLLVRDEPRDIVDTVDSALILNSVILQPNWRPPKSKIHRAIGVRLPSMPICHAHQACTLATPNQICTHCCWCRHTQHLSLFLGHERLEVDGRRHTVEALPALDDVFSVVPVALSRSVPMIVKRVRRDRGHVGNRRARRPRYQQPADTCWNPLSYVVSIAELSMAR